MRHYRLKSKYIGSKYIINNFSPSITTQLKIEFEYKLINLDKFEVKQEQEQEQKIYKDSRQRKLYGSF